MAFSGLTFDISQILDMSKFKVFTKTIEVLTAKLFAKTIGGYKKLEKKTEKKRKKIGKGISIALDVLGIFLQVLDAMGVLEPIMEIFNGLLQIIGGSVMETLAPALKEFAEILFGEDKMELWKKLGVLIAKLVEMGLGALLIVILALVPVFLLLLPVIIFIIKAIGFLIITAFIPLITIILMFGTVVASIADLINGILSAITGGKHKATNFAAEWVSMMGGILFGLISGAANIVTMGAGGYVGPSSGGTVVKLGESGEGEFVVPESKMFGIADNSEKLLWATEDNGDKLDMLINIMNSQGRLIG